MSKIYVLPENISAKIAAGEVVQRPESVVKELLENSIDAGALNIILIIKNAGKTLIQIIDDGCGMTSEDALISLKRHSTSKIKTFDDLDRLNTFGFRGEALYSIGSVARLELKTKDIESELGIFIVCEDGSIVEESMVKCETGTNISVKNLFFNIPARRKFLKSNASEFKHIYETWLRTALSNPQIRFKIIEDDKILYDLPSQSLEKRLVTFYGDTFFNSLIQINSSYDDISIFGYICSPNFSRKNRGDQFIFLNNRFIINKSINSAVFRAYEHLIEKGDYPFFLLFININPAKIDINVHPSKLEVKFDDDQLIFGTLFNTIKNTLSKFDFTPKINLIPNSSSFDDMKLDLTDSTPKIFNPYSPHLSTFQSKKDFSPAHSHSEFQSNRLIDSALSFIDSLSSNSSQNMDNIFSKRVVWQLHNKYILTPIKNGMMIIDQHVAHERILYEKTLACFEANIPMSQQLLFSESIDLKPPDFSLVMELQELLFKIGFDFKQSGKCNIILSGVPHDIKSGKEKTTLLEILEAYRDYSNILIKKVSDNLAKSYACKTAIKAGDNLSESEMLSLIDNLFACKITNVCPHGRPIIIKLTLDELDRRFGRTVKPEEDNYGI